MTNEREKTAEKLPEKTPAVLPLVAEKPPTTKPIEKPIETTKPVVSIPFWRGDRPELKFSAKAWIKLLHCRDAYNDEIAAYGITIGDDLLYVDDIWIPKQSVSAGSFEFDDDDNSEMIDRFYGELGIEPYRCSRIWIHTHPQGVNGPSGTDENTFAKVFGNFSWSIMVIFPKSGEPYAALRINAKGVPEIRIKLPVSGDFTEVEAFDLNNLKADIAANVSATHYVYPGALIYYTKKERKKKKKREEDLQNGALFDWTGYGDEDESDPDFDPLSSHTEFWYNGWCEVCGTYDTLNDAGECEGCCAHLEATNKWGKK